MTFYGAVVLPRLCHLVMSNQRLRSYRMRTISAAEGRVLEVGLGSGLNLPFYGPQTREIFGLEPSPALLGMARRSAERSAAPVALIQGSAEAIPLDDDSFDTVVATWTLCTIPDATGALGEMRRVLKPSGRLLFVEHGRAPDSGVRKWQDRLTPAWRRLSGGCHLNRPIQAMIESAGFSCERVETGYAPGPKAMAFMYQGSARRA